MKRFMFCVMTVFFCFVTAQAYGAEKRAEKKPAQKPKTVQKTKSLETTYHALIIGNNQYKYLPRLKTAQNDAREVERLLREKFNFKTELVLDATRDDILDQMNEFRKRLKENDNLLIYYAGHGEFDKTVDKAYWLPVDAQKDNPKKWIIADDITSSIKRIAARHVPIVSDSCYSGTLGRQAITELISSGGRDGYLRKMQERPSRTLMASGGNEPVSDSGGGNNSVFAAAFLKALKESDKTNFTAEEVFHGRIKPIVAGKSDQVPEYSSIKNSGDEGGDFVFRLARMEVETGKAKTDGRAERPPEPISVPPAKPFSIKDLEAKDAAEKAAWDNKLKDMKAALGIVEKYEKGGGSSDSKVLAWQRFLDTYDKKNPYSDEDTRYREKAEKQIEYWQGEQQAVVEPKVKKAKKDSVSGIEMVLVKGGCFQMGDTFGDGDRDEKPVHEACVDDFYLGKYEVTQGQWKAIMGSNPAHFKNGDNYPVEQVSWNDAQEFIQKLNQRTGKRYRLPTEAEWEYAARSGGKQEKWAGTSNESELGAYAWYDRNAGSKTHPAGEKNPNGLGLYDMSGNVWEWCLDWYGGYQSGSLTNPTGPSSGSLRVIRGGGWGNGPRYVRAALRFNYAPGSRGPDIGFRLAGPK